MTNNDKVAHSKDVMCICVSMATCFSKLLHIALTEQIGIILGQDWTCSIKLSQTGMQELARFTLKHMQYVFTKRGVTQVNDNQPSLTTYRR